MTHAVSRLQRVAALSAAAGFAIIVAGAPAFAQDAKPAAPAAKEAGKDAKKSTQWVKLCDKITINAKPKDAAAKDAAGKDAAPPAKDAKDANAPAGEEKQLCSTMFEAIESNTGQLIVSVGLQEIEGAPKQVLAVMVPLGLVIPAGVKLAVYNADQWARAAKNETIELKDLKTIDLKFSHCLPIGCTAETEGTKEVTDTLKGNAGLAVLAIWTNGRQFTVPVPLSGFGDALTGKPVDTKEYSENRRKLMEQIRQRQIELANKAKAEEMKNLPPPPADMQTTVPVAPNAQAPAPAPSTKK